MYSISALQDDLEFSSAHINMILDSMVDLPENAFWVILSSADFFQNQLFRKILSGIPSGIQTVWTQIRLDKTLSLIWVQTVCKIYQQRTLGDKELKRQSRLQ